MPGEEFDSEFEPKFRALYIGTVVENNDPDLLGRVKINIPGLIEPKSGWAFPLGTVGGGIANRGFFFVPDVGAEVGVLFKEGDVDSIFYLAGAWGLPDSGIETPGPAATSTKDRAPNIRSIETKFFRITFDDNDRNGDGEGETLRIVDKNSGDGILIDRNLTSGPNIVIQGTSGIMMTTSGLFKVIATQIQFNDRIMSPDGKQSI